MIAKPMRMQPSVWTIWPSRVALLTIGLFLFVLSAPDGGQVADADAPPTAEEQERYLDWYKHNGSLQAPVTGTTTPTQEDIVRFLDWYKHNVAPQPSGLADTPTAEDVARYLEWYKHNGEPKLSPPGSAATTASAQAEEIARYLDWFKHNGAPKALPMPADTTAATQQEVARFQEWCRHNGAPNASLSSSGNAVATAQPMPDETARYLEWLKRNGAPSAIGAPASLDPPPTTNDVVRFREAYRQNSTQTPYPAQRPQLMPAVTAIDVHPLADKAMPLLVAQERLRPVPPPPPRPMVDDIVQAAAKQDVPLTLPPILIDAPPPAAPPRPMPLDLPLPAPSPTTGRMTTNTPSLSVPPPTQAPPTSGSANSTCGSGSCRPASLGCSCGETDAAVSRFFGGVYDCLCCPDPFYEPKWIPLADSAFFVEAARPQTQVRLRWDSGLNLVDPDRAEYFWARADGKGVGPNPFAHANPNGLLGEKSLDYNDLNLYTEAAYGNYGAFVEMPYRWLQGDVVGNTNGFGDMNFGAKALLFDTELLQIALQFRTFLPFGDPAKGLGTGHVSLEPGLLVGLKLGPETYFQGQLEEWIPIGGEADYEGAILEYHLSVNQLLYCPMPDVQLVGTAELNGWSFQGGEYTDPFAGPGQRAAGATYLSMGPGLRLFLGDQIDFGVGMAFALTEQHWAEQLYRTEFRWRF
jgi:hypothetical protein